MSRRRRAGGRAGFTLVEMIVAAVLLALCVTGALAAISAAARAVAISEQSNAAAMLAQNRFAELETRAGNLASGERSGEFGEEFPGYRWRENIETTPFDDLFKVTMTIEWGVPNGRRAREFVTYLRRETERERRR